MPETILSPSQIKLFGRLFGGLTLNIPEKEFVDPNVELAPGTAEIDLSSEEEQAKKSSKKKSPPESNASFDQLTNQILRENAMLARIYSCSYRGEYITLPEPSIFLVHGVGREIEPSTNGVIDRSGVASRDWVFEKDVRYWEYDRITYSLRCDLSSGTIEELLAQACGDFGDKEVGANPDIAARSHLSSRSHLNARSHLTARHRIG